MSDDDRIIRVLLYPEPKKLEWGPSKGPPIEAAMTISNHHMCSFGPPRPRKAPEAPAKAGFALGPAKPEKPRKIGLRTIRKRMRLSQVRLAAAVGVSQTDISRLESGELKGSIGLWRRIEAALKAPMAELRWPV
jgi:DNA-binding XRE family transcriptional regulator